MNEVFPEIFDALSRAEKCIGDILVFPVGTGGIGLEQDVGSSDFLRSAFEFVDDIETGFSFVVEGAVTHAAEVLIGNLCG